MLGVNSMRYKWCEEVKKYSYKDKVILANRFNGKWIRLSKELYEILEQIIDKGVSIEDVEFDSIDDKKYFGELFVSLKDLDIIWNKGKIQKSENKIASIELTERCNLRCIHCCMNAQNNIPSTADMSYEKMIQILEKIVRWNPKSIMLSGGEPMLRKDFFELAEYIRKNFEGQVILSTNGVLINEKNVAKLINLVDQIEISLDGYNEETCSLIRGQGVFEKVINNVKLLQRNGFTNISLSMATADKNAKWEKEFSKLNNKLGTRPVFRMFSAVGRGKDSKEFFTDKTEDEVYIPEEYLKKNREKPDSVCCCSAGKREIFVNHNGDVFPCPSYMAKEYYLGNLLDVDGVDELTREYDNIQMVLEGLKRHGITDERCKDCVVRDFCWTCPGSVDSITNINHGIRMGNIVNNIRFENVSFSYNDDVDILKKINMTFPTGSVTGIVGNTGCGKTTIIKLLYRLWDINSGRISIDNIAIQDYNLYNIRKQISIVSQDVFAFNDTIWNNIVGTSKKEKNEVLEICKAVGVDEFVAKMQKGYDTVIGERGARLSGGQKQKIALARALVSGGKVLILDEATAALDNVSQNKVIRNLLPYLKNKITIIIAHRLETIKNADQIYVLNDGKCVGNGSHDMLLRNCQEYKELYAIEKKRKYEIC